MVFAGGGTGGHIYPALAVAEEVKRRRPEARFLFIGGDRMETKLVPGAGLPFRRIAVHGIAGRGLAGGTRRVRGAVELLLGVPLVQSLLALRSFHPHVVIGTGGYVSGPVLLASHLMRLPSIAIEGNRNPGWTSRMVSKLADVMAVAHPEQAAFFAERMGRSGRVALTGLPIRSDITSTTRHEGAFALNLDPTRTTLLVLGGSLGSKAINEAVVGALRLLGRDDDRISEVQVLHVTGPWRCTSMSPGELETFVPYYRAVDYLHDDYPKALAAADLVVSRAGASTVAELAARGLPAVLIPWAGATGGEQVLNAEPLGQCGAAVIIPDTELSNQYLKGTLATLLWDREKRGQMERAGRLLAIPQAAEKVALLALRLADGEDVD